MSNTPDLMTVPRFESAGFLVHGFGTRIFDRGRMAAFSTTHGFRPVLLNQVHSDRIRLVDEVPDTPPDGDALVTARPSLLLVIRTADCLPILLTDTRRRLAAAVHCGWRGTSLGLVSRVIRFLRERWDSRAADILAAMGPCIQGDCYEVGEDVRRAFDRAKPTGGCFRDHPGRPGKFLLDLRETNHRQLLRAGVPDDRIFRVGGCTHCGEEFFSFRRDSHRAGRLINMIGMRF